MYYRLNESLSNKLEAVPGKLTNSNIYGVMFERTADVEYLNGTNVQTRPTLWRLGNDSTTAKGFQQKHVYILAAVCLP